MEAIHKLIMKLNTAQSCYNSEIEARVIEFFNKEIKPVMVQNHIKYDGTFFYSKAGRIRADDIPDIIKYCCNIHEYTDRSVVSYFPADKGYRVIVHGGGVFTPSNVWDTVVLDTGKYLERSETGGADALFTWLQESDTHFWPGLKEVHKFILVEPKLCRVSEFDTYDELKAVL